MSDTLRFPWNHEKRYNDYSTYFRRIFDGRVQKISLHAGFTCPNRDGSRARGGCTFCNNQTFQPEYCDPHVDIREQLAEGVTFFGRKYQGMRYLAYFQSYSNTYGPVDHLRNLYEEALKHPGVIGLVIATRPDCLGPDVLDLLEELSQRTFLIVEVGIETFEADTLIRINRGHTADEARQAIRDLAARKIRHGAHLMLGFPGETRDQFLNQARMVNELPVEVIKLHQLQIHVHTAMEQEYAQFPERFTLFDVDDYVELVVDYLELLRPDIIVERFVSFAPDPMVIAPKWGLKNFEFVAKVEKRLLERDTWQGRLYTK